MPVRRPSTALLASIVVHVIVAAFFVQALVLQRPLIDIFGRKHVPQVGPVERIGFLRLPQAPSNAAPTPGKRGGDGRPLTPFHPLVAPNVIPPVIPKAAMPTQHPEPEPEPGTGPLVGGGGETQGVQPKYKDPRLWGPPGSVATAPKSTEQRLDSLIGSVIGAHNDSMRVATGSQREPGDWTVEHNGQKFGVDRKFIHLGPVSIPTAVLAMLPLNITNNPTVMDRDRRFTDMHNEIFSQAQRGINDADFQKAVRSIRERKERERKEQQAKQKAADSSAAQQH